MSLHGIQKAGPGWGTLLKKAQRTTNCWNGWQREACGNPVCAACYPAAAAAFLLEHTHIG